MSLDTVVPTAPASLYARFSRRFRGIVIDWMIAMAVVFGAVFLAITVENDNFSRALGLLVISALLLYEPILVSFTGATLGHYFTNLRVVDERSGGNVGFSKSLRPRRDQGLAWLVLVRDFGCHAPQPGGSRPADAVNRANPRSGKRASGSVHH
jgi:hypothetical protein